MSEVFQFINNTTSHSILWLLFFEYMSVFAPFSAILVLMLPFRKFLRRKNVPEQDALTSYFDMAENGSKRKMEDLAVLAIVNLLIAGVYAFAFYKLGIRVRGNHMVTGLLAWAFIFAIGTLVYAKRSDDEFDASYILTAVSAFFSESGLKWDDCDFCVCFLVHGMDYVPASGCEKMLRYAKDESEQLPKRGRSIIEVFLHELRSVCQRDDSIELDDDGERAVQLLQDAIDNFKEGKNQNVDTNPS